MAEYHVGIGLAGVIYAGTLTKDKKRWVNKSDVTDEVVAAFWAWLQEQYEEAAEETGLECDWGLERTISYPNSKYEIVFRKKKKDDANASYESGGWISCEERMPEDNRPVLCYVRDITGEGSGYIIGSCEHSEFWFLKISGNKCFSFPYMRIKVTHWMPLPEPPKIGGRNE